VNLRVGGIGLTDRGVEPFSRLTPSRGLGIRGANLLRGVLTCALPSSKNWVLASFYFFTPWGDGLLGTCFDEERSETRKQL
jgi:hypothetical protein